MGGDWLVELDWSRLVWTGWRIGQYSVRSGKCGLLLVWVGYARLEAIGDWDE